MTAQSQREYRFVFFDLDGTLYDVMAAADAASAAAFKLACDLLSLDKERVPYLTQTFWQEYFRYAQEAKTTEPAEVLPVLFHRTLSPKRREAEANQALWDRLTRVWLDQFMAHTTPFSPVAGLLDWLQKGGIGRGIISNGAGRWQRLKLANLGLNGYFPEENLFFSDERGLAKPEPGIFHLALDSCGLTAAETIFMGDSPVTDVPGALAVGLTVIWLNRYKLTAPRTDSLPGRMLEVVSFSQAADLMKRLLFRTGHGPSPNRKQSAGQIS